MIHLKPPTLFEVLHATGESSEKKLPETRESRAGSDQSRASSPSPSQHALANLGQQINNATVANEATSGAGRDELEINLRLARAPADMLQHPSLGGTGGTHLSTTNTSVGTDASHVTADRIGLLYNQAALGGNQGLSGQIGTTMGLIYGGVTQQVGSVAVTGYAGGIGPTSVVGASVTKTIGNVGVIGGASLVMTGDARLRVIKYSNQQYQVEYKDVVSVAGQMVGGVSSGHLGLGIRIGASKVRTIAYKSWVSPKEAETLTKKRSRLHDKLSVLRLRKPLLPIPKMSDPLNTEVSAKNTVQMKIGDEIFVTYTGRLLGGISATGGGVYIGAHVSLAGTHQLEIKKISAHEVEVAVLPGQKSKAVAFGVDLPVVAEGHVMMSRSHATRHAYVFDLRHDDALEAYKKAIDGDLPGTLYEVENHTVLGARQAQTAVAQAVMPRGVRYNQLEQSAISFETTVGGGITLPRILPFVNLAGVGIERRFRTEHNVIATSDAAIHQSSTRRETEVQNLNRGSSEVASYGSLQMVYKSDESAPSLGGVTVGVVFTTDRTQRKSRNKIISSLQSQGLVDADLGAFADKATRSKYEYEVKLERVISNETLERTAPDGASAKEHAEQLRSQVTQNGPAGLAALSGRFENTRSQLRYSVNSGGPEALLRKTVDLGATYQKPINPLTDKPRAIARRIKDVNKYLDRISKLRQDIEADPLLRQLDPESKVEQLASLAHSEAGLKRIVHLGHLAPNAKAYLISQSSSSVRKILEDWKKKGML